MPLSNGLALLKNHLQGTFNVSVGFWALSAIGLILGWLNRELRGRTCWVSVFWLCSFLATATGLYFRSHYFILVLPAFAILTGLGVVAMQRALRFPVLHDVFQSLPLILFGLIFSWVVFYQGQFFFQLPPLRAGASLYQYNPFEEALAAGDYIRGHSAPDARVAVVGSEPEIYFYARRHSATGYIYTYALVESQPAAAAMQRDMMRGIESQKPDFLVYVSFGLSWLVSPAGSEEPIDKWFDQYSGRFFEPVAVIHRNAAGRVECLQGDAAKKYRSMPDDYLAIFRRRT